jgi:ribosomal protein S18 acetylase RimI-like enzyme
VATHVHVRPATLTDAAAIATVHIRSWQSAYAQILPDAYLQGLSVETRTSGWQQALQSDASKVAVAAADEQVVGFVSFGRCRDPGAPASRAEIWALYAAPHAWGLGVGLQLMRHALTQAASEGYADTSLWVLSANARAIRFYGAGGFRVVPGSEKHFPLGGVEVPEIQLLRPGAEAQP